MVAGSLSKTRPYRARRASEGVWPKYERNILFKCERSLKPAIAAMSAMAQVGGQRVAQQLTRARFRRISRTQAENDFPAPSNNCWTDAPTIEPAPSAGLP